MELRNTQYTQIKNYQPVLTRHQNRPQTTTNKRLQVRNLIGQLEQCSPATPQFPFTYSSEESNLQNIEEFKSRVQNQVKDPHQDHFREYIDEKIDDFMVQEGNHFKNVKVLANSNSHRQRRPNTQNNSRRDRQVLSSSQLLHRKSSDQMGSYKLIGKETSIRQSLWQLMETTKNSTEYQKKITNRRPTFINETTEYRNMISTDAFNESSTNLYNFNPILQQRESDAVFNQVVHDTIFKGEQSEMMQRARRLNKLSQICSKNADIYSKFRNQINSSKDNFNKTTKHLSNFPEEEEGFNKFYVRLQDFAEQSLNNLRQMRKLYTGSANQELKPKIKNKIMRRRKGGFQSQQISPQRDASIQSMKQEGVKNDLSKEELEFIKEKVIAQMGQNKIEKNQDLKQVLRQIINDTVRNNLSKSQVIQVSQQDKLTDKQQFKLQNFIGNELVKKIGVKDEENKEKFKAMLQNAIRKKVVAEERKPIQRQRSNVSKKSINCKSNELPVSQVVDINSKAKQMINHQKIKRSGSIIVKKDPLLEQGDYLIKVKKPEDEPLFKTMQGLNKWFKNSYNQNQQSVSSFLNIPKKEEEDYQVVDNSFTIFEGTSNKDSSRFDVLQQDVKSNKQLRKKQQNLIRRSSDSLTMLTEKPFENQIPSSRKRNTISAPRIYRTSTHQNSQKQLKNEKSFYQAKKKSKLIRRTTHQQLIKDNEFVKMFMNLQQQNLSQEQRELKRQSLNMSCLAHQQEKLIKEEVICYSQKIASLSKVQLQKSQLELGHVTKKYQKLSLKEGFYVKKQWPLKPFTEIMKRGFYFERFFISNADLMNDFTFNRKRRNSDPCLLIAQKEETYQQQSQIVVSKKNCYDVAYSQQQQKLSFDDSHNMRFNNHLKYFRVLDSDNYKYQNILAKFEKQPTIYKMFSNKDYEELKFIKLLNNLKNSFLGFIKNQMIKQEIFKSVERLSNISKKDSKHGQNQQQKTCFILYTSNKHYECTQRENIYEFKMKLLKFGIPLKLKGMQYYDLVPENLIFLMEQDQKLLAIIGNVMLSPLKHNQQIVELDPYYKRYCPLNRTQNKIKSIVPFNEYDGRKQIKKNKEIRLEQQKQRLSLSHLMHMDYKSYINNKVTLSNEQHSKYAMICGQNFTKEIREFTIKNNAMNDFFAKYQGQRIDNLVHFRQKKDIQRLLFNSKNQNIQLLLIKREYYNALDQEMFKMVKISENRKQKRLWSASSAISRSMKSPLRRTTVKVKLGQFRPEHQPQTIIGAIHKQNFRLDKVLEPVCLVDEPLRRYDVMGNIGEPVRLQDSFSYYPDYIVLKELNYTPFYVYLPYKRNRLISLLSNALKMKIITKIEEELELCSDSSNEKNIIRMQTAFDVKDEFTQAILRKLNVLRNYQEKEDKKVKIKSDFIKQQSLRRKNNIIHKMQSLSRLKLSLEEVKVNDDMSSAWSMDYEEGASPMIQGVSIEQDAEYVTFSDEEEYHFKLGNSIYQQRKEELKRNEFLLNIVKEADVDKRVNLKLKLRSINTSFMKNPADKLMIFDTRDKIVQDFHLASDRNKEESFSRQASMEGTKSPFTPKNFNRRQSMINKFRKASSRSAFKGAALKPGNFLDIPFGKKDQFNDVESNFQDSCISVTEIEPDKQAEHILKMQKDKSKTGQNLLDLMKKDFNSWHPDYLQKHSFESPHIRQLQLNENTQTSVALQSAMKKRSYDYDNLIEKIFELATQNQKKIYFEYYMNRFMVDSEVKDKSGNTLLSVAAQNGVFEIAQYMIERGANLNTQNMYGNTPLHYAWGYKYKKVSDLLFTNGADDRIRNHEDKRPCEF